MKALNGRRLALSRLNDVRGRLRSLSILLLMLLLMLCHRVISLGQHLCVVSAHHSDPMSVRSDHHVSIHTSTRSQAAAYFPQLDALRAIAVFVVLLHHYLPWRWVQRLALGPMAVQLFFVISGFLITGILLRSRQLIQTQQATLKQALAVFFARRSLRILPAYWLLLGLAYLANTPGVREQFFWHLTYGTNIWLGLQQSWDGYLSLLWSLAVEEQFYLLWPLLILGLPRRWLGPVIAGAVAIAPFARWGLLTLEVHPIWVATALLTNLDTLGMGALLAWIIWERQHWIEHWKAAWAQQEKLEDGPSSAPLTQDFGRIWSFSLHRWSLLIGLPLFTACKTMNLAGYGNSFTIAFTYLGLAGCLAWLVQRSALGFSGRVGLLLESPTLLYLGKISYGIYLYHMVITDWFFRGMGLPRPEALGLRLPLYCGLTLAIASASWFFWESPWLRLKSRFRLAPLPVSSRPERKRAIALR